MSGHVCEIYVTATSQVLTRTRFGPCRRPALFARDALAGAALSKYLTPWRPVMPFLPAPGSGSLPRIGCHTTATNLLSAAGGGQLGQNSSDVDRPMVARIGTSASPTHPDRGTCPVLFPHPKTAILGIFDRIVCLFDQEHDLLFLAFRDLDLVAGFPDQIGDSITDSGSVQRTSRGRPAAALSAPFASSRPAAGI